MEDIICICTKGRLDDQFTLDNMSEENIGRTIVICGIGEKLKLMEKYPKLLEVIEDKANIAEARDLGINIGKNKYGANYILFIDDNVLFKRGIILKDDFPEFDKIIHSQTELQNIYVNDTFKTLREGYGMTGALFSGYNNFGPGRNADYWFHRAFGTFGVNIEKYLKLNERFSDISHTEDFYVEMSFLYNEIDCKIIKSVCFQKKNGANAKGGCSITRTADLLNECTEFITRKYPKYTNARKKKAYKNMDTDYIVDPHIKWKKLYDECIVNTNSMIEPERIQYWNKIKAILNEHKIKNKLF